VVSRDKDTVPLFMKSMKGTRGRSALASIQRWSSPLVPGGGVEPPRAEARRILSTQKGSDPFGKFSTLLYFSTAYKSDELNRYGLICTVLTMELLQFHYSGFRATGGDLHFETKAGSLWYRSFRSGFRRADLTRGSLALCSKSSLTTDPAASIRRSIRCAAELL